MSLLSDVTSVKVSVLPDLDIAYNGRAIVSVQNVFEPPRVSINTQTTQTVKVISRGPQGRPGDQMVYPQPNNPAIEFGWGPEDAGKIWIRTEV